MQLELSEEQELFATSLREWIAAKFTTETVRRLQSDGDTSTFTAALINEGWWAVGYPEQAGGQGGGVLELALTAREFGRAAVPDASWLAATVAAPLLTDAELAAQIEGEQRYALALRGDRIPDWSAVESDRGCLSGTVAHVLGAPEADVFLVPVEGGLARLSAEAVTVSAEPLLDRSRAAGTIEFAEVAVTDVQAVDDAALVRATALAAMLVAADALGAAERMLELSVEYSKQRKQFGRPIGSFQAVKHAAAQMLVSVEAAYSIALYAAAALDGGRPDATTTAAAAKAQVTGGAVGVADSALTVHGAIGYTWEHDLHLFYKRAKLDRTLFGTPRAWNERIATALLDETAIP